MPIFILHAAFIQKVKYEVEADNANEAESLFYELSDRELKRSMTQKEGFELVLEAIKQKRSK